MPDSTRKPGKRKPVKPYTGYPMFAHGSGQWAKKIRGKLFYFGVWANPEAALERLNREYPYLKDGREPPPIDVSNGCSLRQLCNAFLELQENRLNSGELAPRSFQSYFNVCNVLIEHFDKGRLVADLCPLDFQGLRSALAGRYGIGTLRYMINVIRIVFNFAWKNNLIDRPVNYGTGFEKPSAKAIRKLRNDGGDKIFTREEVLRILDYLESKGDVVMRSMVLLAVNCGFGNTDVSDLPQKAVDFKSGWVNFPRPKTQIPRRIPLWPETIDALQKAIKSRPGARNAADGRLCFLTPKRRPWVMVQRKKQQEGAPPTFVSWDAVRVEFKKILTHLEINGRRRLGFYTFRHVFETQAGESCDQVAVDAVMGHVDSSMAANYRHGVSDECLRAVVAVVHNWLFGKAK